MADYDSYALPEVSADQDYSRQLEQAQLADRQRQQAMANADKKRQRRLSQADRQRQNQAAGALSVAGEAQTVARTAYTKVWQLAEEGIQDFALSFADLMLLSGPAAVTMFLIRLIGGNVFGGSGTVTYREMSIPRIPGYSVPEGTYRAGKVFLIGVVSGSIYLVIFFLAVAIANPGLILKFGLCSAFGGIISFFGSTVCST